MSAAGSIFCSELYRRPVTRSVAQETFIISQKATEHTEPVGIDTGGTCNAFLDSVDNKVIIQRERVAAVRKEIRK